MTELALTEDAVREILVGARTAWTQAERELGHAVSRDPGAHSRAERFERAAVAATVSAAASRLAHAMTGLLRLHMAQEAEQAAEGRTQALLAEVERSEQQDRQPYEKPALTGPFSEGEVLPVEVEPILVGDGLARLRFNRPGRYQVSVSPGGAGVGVTPLHGPDYSPPPPPHPYVRKQESPTHCLLAVAGGVSCNKPPDDPIHQVIPDDTAGRGPEVRPDA